MIHKISAQSADYNGNSGEHETASQVTDGDRGTEPPAYAEHEKPPLKNILNFSGTLMCSWPVFHPWTLPVAVN